MFFKSKHKLCCTELKLMLCRNISYRSNYVRYLRTKIDENLNRKLHVHDLISKLNKANAILSKVRHFVISEIMRSVYFTISHPNVNYVCIAREVT